MSILNYRHNTTQKKPVNFIAVGIILAVFFWIGEGLVHGLLFNQTQLLRNLLMPEVHELWMRSVVSIVIIVSGIVAQVLITRNIRISRELLLSEKKYSKLFEKAPVAITVVNNNGIVSDCNKSTELLTGFSREELIGKPFQKLLTLDAKDLPKLQEKFELLARGRDVAPYELEIVRKDGQRRVINVISSLLIIDGAVQGFQVIAPDITEIKQPPVRQ
ncbi:MAG: PAS domain S-box protein [candidate division WOR-3 bacterium]|nr:MAG: PAS domain S-box protein [candidate division WOR-3 bacterium]